MTELVSSKFGRQRLQYALETAHKARYSLCVGTDDVRYRALDAAMEIANLADNHLPSELREERREILELANRYNHPRTLRKKTGRKLAERIYELCRAIESRYAGHRTTSERVPAIITVRDHSGRVSRRSCAAYMILLLFAGCAPTDWVEEVPGSLHGTWVETDETWPGPPHPRQILELGSQKVRWLRSEYGFKELPVRRVSITGEEIVIFCGAHDEDTIARYRLSMFLRSGGRNLYVREVVSDGGGGDHFFETGLFTRANEDGSF